MGTVIVKTNICDCCGSKQIEKHIEDWMLRNTKKGKKALLQLECERYKEYSPFAIYGYHLTARIGSVFLLCPRCYQSVDNLVRHSEDLFYKRFRKFSREVSREVGDLNESH